MVTKNSKIWVTVVGAGHYGRELVAAKYKDNNSCKLKAVISPTVNPDIIARSPLSGTPLLRTVLEWRAKLGRPTNDDLFDLSVHHQIVPRLVGELSEIGAKNFVLPKPVTLNPEDLDILLELKERHRLNILIASQWHYSEVTSMAKKAVEDILSKEEIERVSFNFSQPASKEQMENYTPISMLLPHILQILHSLDLTPLDTITPMIQEYSEHNLKMELRSSEGDPKIELTTNLESRGKKRILELYVKNKTAPELVADFLGVWRDGKAIKYPTILCRGKKKEIREDNLAVMTNNIIRAFSDKNFTEVLTLEKYLPIIQLLIKVKRASDSFPQGVAKGPK